MEILDALVVTDDDLVDNSKGFDFYNLNPSVFKAALNVEIIFFNGTLVKNRMGSI